MSQKNADAYEVRPTLEQIMSVLSPLGNDTDSHKFVCDQCSKREFTNRSAYRMHMEKKHKKPSDVDRIESILGVCKSNPDQILQFFCPLDTCPKRFYASAKLLIQHFQRKHGEKRFVCENCAACFSLLRDLTYHNKKTCPHAKLHPTILHQPKSEPFKSPAKNGSDENKKTIGTQTEHANRRSKTTKYLLVPINLHRRLLVKRKAPRTTTISTQTDDQSLLVTNKVANKGERVPQMFDDQNVIQADRQFPAVAHQFCQFCTTTNLPITREIQHSFSQTNCPKTVDFGMITDSANSYYSYVDEQSQSQHPPQLVMMHVGGGEESCSFSPLDDYSQWQNHCETQTPVSFLDEAGSLCCYSVNNTTIATQTMNCDTWIYNNSDEFG